MIDQLINRLLQEKRWSEQLQLNRNDFLISKGEIERNIYYVISGTLRVLMEDEEEEHTIRFGYPGTLFTALDSYLTGKPTAYSIQAIKKCELLVMSRQAFQELLKENADYSVFYNTLLEQLVVQQMERETDLLTSSPAERYKRVLQRSPNLFQEIPSKYIASYLRMTPETLSRLKKS